MGGKIREGAEWWSRAEGERGKEKMGDCTGWLLRKSWAVNTRTRRRDDGCVAVAVGEQGDAHTHPLPPSVLPLPFLIQESCSSLVYVPYRLCSWTETCHTIYRYSRNINTFLPICFPTTSLFFPSWWENHWLYCTAEVLNQGCSHIRRMRNLFRDYTSGVNISPNLLRYAM